MPGARSKRDNENRRARARRSAARVSGVASPPHGATRRPAALGSSRRAGMPGAESRSLSSSLRQFEPTGGRRGKRKPAPGNGQRVVRLPLRYAQIRNRTSVGILRSQWCAKTQTSTQLYQQIQPPRCRVHRYMCPYKGFPFRFIRNGPGCYSDLQSTMPRTRHTCRRSPPSPHQRCP